MAEDLGAVRRCVSLAGAGHLSRAARALNRRTMMDVSDPAVREELVKLHPPKRKEIMKVPPEASHVALVSNDRLQRFICEKFCRGQAPGP